MAKILITGAAGFIGKHLQERLAQDSLHFLDRSLLLSQELLTNYFKEIQPDYIYHLAAYGNNMTNAQEDNDIFKVNTLGFWNLLQASTAVPYKGFINISTSSVLLPFQTIYSATKAANEKLIEAYVNKYDKPIVTLRPFSLYGTQDHYNHLIPTIFRSCLYGDEMRIANSPVHDWTYVEDFVEEMVNYALDASAHKGKIVHVGTGEGTSNYWLRKEIEEVTGKKANIVGKYPERLYDNDEWIARSSLGNVSFAPTSLRKGLQQVFRSYKL